MCHVQYGTHAILSSCCWAMRRDVPLLPILYYIQSHLYVQTHGHAISRSTCSFSAEICSSKDSYSRWYVKKTSWSIVCLPSFERFHSISGFFRFRKGTDMECQYRLQTFGINLRTFPIDMNGKLDSFEGVSRFLLFSDDSIYLMGRHV